MKKSSGRSYIFVGTPFDDPRDATVKRRHLSPAEKIAPSLETFQKYRPYDNASSELPHEILYDRHVENIVQEHPHGSKWKPATFFSSRDKKANKRVHVEDDEDDGDEDDGTSRARVGAGAQKRKALVPQDFMDEQDFKDDEQRRERKRLKKFQSFKEQGNASVAATATWSEVVVKPRPINQGYEIMRWMGWSHDKEYTGKTKKIIGPSMPIPADIEPHSNALDDISRYRLGTFLSFVALQKSDRRGFGFKDITQDKGQFDDDEYHALVMHDHKKKLEAERIHRKGGHGSTYARASRNYGDSEDEMDVYGDRDDQNKYASLEKARNKYISQYEISDDDGPSIVSYTEQTNTYNTTQETKRSISLENYRFLPGFVRDDAPQLKKIELTPINVPANFNPYHDFEKDIFQEEWHISKNLIEEAKKFGEKEYRRVVWGEEMLPRLKTLDKKVDEKRTQNNDAVAHAISILGKDISQRFSRAGEIVILNKPDPSYVPPRLGSINRNILYWQPLALLCKRFQLEPPQVNVALLQPKKISKLLLMDEIQGKDNIDPKDKTPAIQKLLPTENSSDENDDGMEYVNSNDNENEDETENESSTLDRNNLNMKLFQAIFANDSSEESETDSGE